MPVDSSLAERSYNEGWYFGTAKRDHRSVPGSPNPANNKLWFDFGQADAVLGRQKRAFVGGVQYAADMYEKQNYDFGYVGASEPRDESARSFFFSGRQDRANGLDKTWALNAAGGPIVSRPPPFEPKPTTTGSPVVVVNPPTPNNGINQPSPVVINPPQPNPPWNQWPPGMQQPLPPWWQWVGSTGGSGFVIYGPWGAIDFSKLQPVGRR